ncbi:alpha/beta fold hydrolase, partial [Streptomyces sp. NPDC058953]|uniref:alpha/beta fold hydrolase n=1 Tax=Streptomyces sp. NPDC058953 TaxID=3346676 RepID=UPI003687C8A7
ACPAEAASRAALARAIEERGVPDSGYFLQSAVEAGPGRWRLLFDWEEMMAVQEGGTGDWWDDWLGSSCPALVAHGGRSTLLSAALARRMAAERPGTELWTSPAAGHWIHDDDLEGFAGAVAAFLDRLPGMRRSRSGPGGGGPAR